MVQRSQYLQAEEEEDGAGDSTRSIAEPVIKLALASQYLNYISTALPTLYFIYYDLSSTSPSFPSPRVLAVLLFSRVADDIDHSCEGRMADPPVLHDPFY